VLLQNFPNPFNPETWIPYELVQDANVTIRIHNAKGQLIRTFSVGEQKAGLYVSKDKATYWDGRDNFGEKVANGVYFYTLQVEPQSRRLPDKLHPNENKVGSFRMTRKMVILK
jgi:flagellar hook assembly protein FlgD